MKTLRILILSLALLIASSVAFQPGMSFADLQTVVFSRLASSVIFQGGTAGQISSIGNNTVDGTDSASLNICGGGLTSTGTCDTGRGAVAILYGNEQGTAGGIQIRTGAVANSVAFLDFQDAGSTLLIRNPSNATKITVDTTGNISVAAGAQYKCTKGGTAATCGTFVANGVTAITITTTAASVNMVVMTSLNTVGGTVGNLPHVVTITPGTSFQVGGTALDTSTYNWVMETLQ